MTKDEIRQLYQSHVLPESKAPYHFQQKLEEAAEIKAFNPFCGDKYALRVQVVGGQIQNLVFDGVGCALSKASTSLLLKALDGKSVEEAGHLCNEFLKALKTGGSMGHEGLDTLIELRNFEGRMDCISLSWTALQNHFSPD